MDSFGSLGYCEIKQTRSDNARTISGRRVDITAADYRVLVSRSLKENLRFTVAMQ